MRNLLSKKVQRLFLFGVHLRKTRVLQLSTFSPKIELSTRRALIDEKIRITVHGLEQGRKVTLQAFMEESNKQFGACGHYIVDSNGKVDTFESPSFGGTFEGVEPMGLFWSMKTTPSMKPGRLYKANVMVPYDVTVRVLDGFHEFHELNWSNNITCLSSSELQRTYAGPGVRKIPVKENGVYGTLFLPQGEGPFPGLIDLFGMTSGIQEFRSALLASRGYASFTVGYIDHEDLTKNYFDIDFKYFLKAFDLLAAHSMVDPESLGGISTCVGGGYLQLIAALRPAMKCIASINSTGIPPGSEQTVEGLHVKPICFRNERTIIKEGKASFLNQFLPEDDTTVIPGWRHGAKFLSIQGLDDQCINPNYLNFVMSHTPKEFQQNSTFITYPGAGHFLEPPYSPHSRFNYNAIINDYLLWGGQPELHAKAQELSWAKILEFLDQNLRKSAHHRAATQV